MRTIFKAENGLFGIQNDGAIEHEAEFTQDEAQDFMSAYNAGAQSYEEATKWLQDEHRRYTISARVG